MKKNLIVGLGIVAVVAVCAFLFMGRSAAEYEKFVPAKADVVMTADLAQLAENTGLTGDRVMKKLNGLLALAPSDISEKVSNIIDNPKELGLRLDKPVYMWTLVGENSFGLSIELGDVEKFKNTLSMLSEKAGIGVDYEKDGDLTWVEIEHNSMIAVAYTSSSLIVSGGAECKANARAWTSLDKDEQYCATDRFERMNDMEGQWKADVFLAKEQLNSVPEYSEALKAFGLDGLELGYVWALNVKKGKVEILTSTYTDDKELQSLMKDLPGSNKIKGVYADYVPDNYIVWGGSNADMKKAMKAVKDLEPMQKIFAQLKEELTLDLPDLLSGVNGDVAFYVAADDIDGDEVDVTVRCEVDDENFIENIVAELTRINPEFEQQMRKNGVGDYDILSKKLGMHNFQYTYSYEESGVFGQHDGTFYFSNNKDNKTLGAKTEALSDYKSEIGSSYTFVVINLKQVAKMLEKNMNRGRDRMQKRMAHKVLSELKDVTFVVREGGKSVTTCNFKDNDMTVADIVMSIVDAAF